MKKIVQALQSLLIVLTIFAVGAVVVSNYSFFFARTVKGQIFEVERSNPAAILAGGVPNSQVFSYAVGIKDPQTGEILTASSEDRQWGVARAGLCVEAKFYPYPPWNLDKAGTYYNARLMKMYECPSLTEGKSVSGESGASASPALSSGSAQAAPAAPAGPAEPAAASESRAKSESKQ